MTIKITGIKQLDKKLAEMPVTMQKKAMRKGVRNAAKLTLNQAKSEVPHDTGALEASLKVKAAKRSRRFKNMVASNVETSEGLFSGDQFYGGMVEFGTKERFTKSGASRGFIVKNAFAFLRPALYDSPARKRRIFITEISRWIRAQSVPPKKK